MNPPALSDEEASSIFRDILFTEYAPGAPDMESLRQPGLVLLCRELEKTPHIYRWEVIDWFDAPEDAVEVAARVLAGATAEASRTFVQLAALPEATHRQRVVQAMAVVCRRDG